MMPRFASSFSRPFCPSLLPPLPCSAITTGSLPSTFSGRTISTARQTEVGVVGEFVGAAAGAFGEVALGQGLQTPGDAFDQPGFVVGVSGFAEDLGVAGLQLLGAHLVQGTEAQGNSERV
jgi:hypothetical protein